MDVINYVREEVSRQGHDTFSLEGIERVGWMLDGWAYALECRGKPSMGDVEVIGKKVERHKNKQGIRTVGVRVGLRVCPPPEEVIQRLLRLFKLRDSMTPMEFYKEFELIHPFVDGNGRTGKILLNWLNGTLYEPIFPPADLFGEPIRNP